MMVKWDEDKITQVTNSLWRAILDSKDPAGRERERRV